MHLSEVMSDGYLNGATQAEKNTSATFADVEDKGTYNHFW